jgi:murein DD-endopeptidase MepM/ murein hydrolase activator NlpD
MGERKPFAVAIFLLAGLVAASLLQAYAGSVRGAERGVWGGPLHGRWNEGNALAYLASQPRLGAFSMHATGASELESAAYAPHATALDNFGRAPGFAPRTEFASYKVVRGDTFSKIAAKFGVSLDTVLKANPGVKANRLVLGATLQIPPVSGTVYFVKDGDTLESIADAFGVASKDIASVNRAANLAMLTPGARLIIPGAKGTRVFEQGKPLPVLKNYFISPAAGFNWGRVHPANAVDIAGVCGTPVVAAAEGLVIPDEQYGEGGGGWNGGYGTFVLIEHPAGNNIRTRYAHLRVPSVEVGEYVKQGQAIGTMGDTGDAVGCHVHFEVLGAANPFIK